MHNVNILLMILRWNTTAKDFTKEIHYKWFYSRSAFKIRKVSRLIGLVGRVFANGPEDLGSIPGQVIQKTLIWYLIPPCLILGNIRYVSRVKWSNPGKGVAPYPTYRCSSYWKGSLLVGLDYGRQLYLLLYYVEECTDTIYQPLRSGRIWHKVNF